MIATKEDFIKAFLVLKESGDINLSDYNYELWTKLSCEQLDKVDSLKEYYDNESEIMLRIFPEL